MSTGEAQSANYLKSRTDYTTQCHAVSKCKTGNYDELNPVNIADRARGRELANMAAASTLRAYMQ
jgi:hypothetical protein